MFYDPLYYWNNPIEILPFRINPTFEFTGFAGLASHGGILGALIALSFYKRKFEKDYLWMLDRLVIGGALLGGFIRIGNFDELRTDWVFLLNFPGHSYFPASIKLRDILLKLYEAIILSINIIDFIPYLAVGESQQLQGLSIWIRDIP
ncbi:MAG: prolipoprotein diacylglyceryl transferase family protein [Cytophagales bacterium]|nr:prolipoprotein diacylglyceryl transferase family protein [Cytophagales bacterium]